MNTFKAGLLELCERMVARDRPGCALTCMQLRDFLCERGGEGDEEEGDWLASLDWREAKMENASELGDAHLKLRGLAWFWGKGSVSFVLARGGTTTLLEDFKTTRPS